MNDNVKKHIKLRFDKSYKTYDQYCSIQNNICDKTIKLLLKHACKPKYLADFACGTGESTKKLVERFKYYKCYGIDLSDVLLQTAKHKLPSDVDFIAADFDRIIFNKNCFDLIFSNMALQWSLDFSNTLLIF